MKTYHCLLLLLMFGGCISTKKFETYNGLVVKLPPGTSKIDTLTATSFQSSIEGFVSSPFPDNYISDGVFIGVRIRKYEDSAYPLRAIVKGIDRLHRQEPTKGETYLGYTLNETTSCEYAVISIKYTRQIIGYSKIIRLDDEHSGCAIQLVFAAKDSVKGEQKLSYILNNIKAKTKK